MGARQTSMMVQWCHQCSEKRFEHWLLEGHWSNTECGLGHHLEGVLGSSLVRKSNILSRFWVLGRYWRHLSIDVAPEFDLS